MSASTIISSAVAATTSALSDTVSSMASATPSASFIASSVASATATAAASLVGSATPTPTESSGGSSVADVIINSRLAIFWISGGFALLSTALSFFSIYKHMVNYRKPEVQRRIVRILWMVPIYAVDSWLSLRFESVAIYLNTARNVYESYVLYQFFGLLVSWLNGEPEINRILANKDPISQPWPFNYCFRDSKPAHPTFFLRMKRGILQFVIIKPTLAIISIILMLCNEFDEGHWSVSKGWGYIAIVDNTSISIAFYCLAIFYVSVKDQLAPFKPVPKFMCVKAIIFFSFWQGIVISGLVTVDLIHDVGNYTAENVSTGVQNFLICIEMLFAACAHAYAFPYKEYEGMMNDSKLTMWKTVLDIIQIRDVVDDTSTSFNIRPGLNYGKLRDVKTTEEEEDDASTPHRHAMTDEVNDSDEEMDILHVRRTTKLDPETMDLV
eukprot:Opistho-2@68651